jgi:hypothetical protein
MIKKEELTGGLSRILNWVICFPFLDWAGCGRYFPGTRRLTIFQKQVEIKMKHDGTGIFTI